MRCALKGEPGSIVAAGDLLYIVAVGYSSAVVMRVVVVLVRVLGGR